MAKWIRYQLCKRIFLHCGKNVNIERFAYFGNGFKIEIGNNSGVGVHCSIPNDIIIGNDVMMGPHCFILSVNHCFSETDIPMNLQGFQKAKRTVIDDDVWISRNVTMTPGRHISRGSIIGACCLLCKDFPEYSIVGGNPSSLIKKRK
jgi:maltose O-acetyltransferase